MNQFPALVEYLLLTHDYVVIPGLGTFIVQQMNARRNDEEEAFLPPYRSVRFNAELTHTDSLVLEAIREIYHVSQVQAEQMLVTWVNDFRQTLEDEGCYDFGAVGIFTIEEDNSMVFTSQIAGVTTPEYYGLDAFHFSEIAPAEKLKAVPKTASMEADEKAIIIRINRRIANFAVAACAAVLLFMVFNLPMPESQVLEQHSSAVEWIIRNTQRPQPQETISQPIARKAVERQNIAEVPKASPAPTPKAETPITQEAPVASENPATVETLNEHPFCIVMASALPQANAERYVEKLKQNGFVSARIVTTGKMLRVVVGRYATEAEATQASREIHQRSSEYRSAWVHKL